MANVRLSMRKIQEILRLCWHQNLSTRQAAASCGIGQSTVVDYLARAKKAGLSWPLPEDLDEATLEHMLFSYPVHPDANKRNMPSYEYLHTELRRKHVTLELLWKEYRERNPEGYAYSQFCVHYRKWTNTLDIALRQDYKAGEKLFVDFAGDTVPIHHSTGATTPAYLFVATLGASNYSYVEAVPSRELPSWISCHIHAFEFFNAVPAIVIPDNLKSGVTHPSRYEPDLNPTYQDLAAHYGTTVIPARVRKARDKAKVEASVLIVERWIIAALRNHTFFSVGDLNRVLREKLEDLNGRPLQVLRVSRNHLFETIDKPAMKPLPEKRYELAEWEKHKVNIDYHVEIDHHYYSGPLSIERRGARRARHRNHGRDALQGRAGGFPPEELSPRETHHDVRPHARVP